jgi:hypothetical protein
MNDSFSSKQPPIPGAEATPDSNGSSASAWNSLEVTKLVVTIILAVIGGVYTLITFQQKRDDDRREKEAETAAQQRTLAEEKFRRVAEARSAIWMKVAPTLNDMYAYFLFVGEFKKFSPEEILADKRETDRIMWSNRALFEKQTFDTYTAFINSAFQPYQGWLKDAALRTVPIRPNDSAVRSVAFTNEDNRRCINQTYWLLQKATAHSLDMPDPGIPGINDPEVKASLLGNPTEGVCPNH